MSQWEYSDNYQQSETNNNNSSNNSSDGGSTKSSLSEAHNNNNNNNNNTLRSPVNSFPTLSLSTSSRNRIGTHSPVFLFKRKYFPSSDLLLKEINDDPIALSLLFHQVLQINQGYSIYIEIYSYQNNNILPLLFDI